MPLLLFVVLRRVSARRSAAQLADGYAGTAGMAVSKEAIVACDAKMKEDMKFGPCEDADGDRGDVGDEGGCVGQLRGIKGTAAKGRRVGMAKWTAARWEMTAARMPTTAAMRTRMEFMNGRGRRRTGGRVDEDGRAADETA